MTPQARLATAVELLGSIFEDYRPADAVASYFFRKRRFVGSKDRRVISDMVWDVLRAKRRTEWHLKRVGGDLSPRFLMFAALVLDGKKVDKLEHWLDGSRYALPGLTEKEFTVLSSLEGKSFGDPQQPDPVKYEFPDWLEPYLKERFKDDFDQQLSAMLDRADLDLRCNALKTDRASVLKMLAKEGFEASVTDYSPWGLRLKGRQNVTASDLFQNGLVEIQDEASQLAAYLADVKPGMRVLDYCAGAGGKTLAMAACMSNKGRIVACDVFEKRLEASSKRIKRAGADNIERHLLIEGDKWQKRRKEAFDLVFVDAPCTGTGTWRRNPDARNRLDKLDLNELVIKQAEILKTVAPLVKKGGHLVYATCSVLFEENQDQVDKFLRDHSDFSLDTSAEERVSKDLGIKLTSNEYMALTPYSHSTDGFFACVMKRSEA